MRLIISKKERRAAESSLDKRRKREVLGYGWTKTRNIFLLGSLQPPILLLIDIT